MSFLVNDTSAIEPHKEFEKINENSNLRIESTINEAFRRRWESYDDVTYTLFSFIASTESTQKNPCTSVQYINTIEAFHKGNANFDNLNGYVMQHETPFRDCGGSHHRFVEEGRVHEVLKQFR